MKKQIKKEIEEPWHAREIEKCIDLTLNFNLKDIEKFHIDSYFKSLMRIVENE